MTQNQMNSDGLNDVERDLLEGMEGFLDALKSETPLDKLFTCRRVVLDLAPHSYTKEQVKGTRMLLNVSQALFAKFLGVSVKTVRAWENGKAPNDIACRFMDEIQRNPDYWRQRLRESITVRNAAS